MSHVVTVKTEFNDLAAVEAACTRMGWTLVRDQRTFAWFGTWANDYSAPDAAYIAAGIKPEEYGKCRHAIKVPGAQYEIGLVENGGKLVPVWDNWCDGGLDVLTSENGMKGFMQAYAIEKAKAEARRKGMPCSEKVLSDGRIELTIHDRRV